MLDPLFNLYLLEAILVIPDKNNVTMENELPYNLSEKESIKLLAPDFKNKQLCNLKFVYILV